MTKTRNVSGGLVVLSLPTMIYYFADAASFGAVYRERFSTEADAEDAFNNEEYLVDKFKWMRMVGGFPKESGFIG